MKSRDGALPTLANVCVVLVEPIHSGNIGSVARAMKNFGAHDLRLVNPRQVLTDDALKLASHSEDVLRGARLYASLQEALADVHWSVATTARTRYHHLPSYLPKEIAQQTVGFSPDHRLALVFGREDNGLSNDEVNLCRVISTIATYTDHTSINLAQAVTIHLYEVYQARLAQNPNYYWDYAEPSQVSILFDRMERVIRGVGFKPRKTLEDFMVGVKRVLNRTPLEDRDVRIWHKIFKQIELFVEKAGQQDFDLGHASKKVDRQHKAGKRKTERSDNSRPGRINLQKSERRRRG